MPRVMRALLLSAVVILAYSWAAPARADAISEEIDEATKLATEICQSPPMNQSSESGSLSAEGNATLGGILRKVMPLSAGATGNVQQTSSYGVLQKDLATAIEQGNNCRVLALQSLLKYLSAQQQAAAPQAIDPDGIYQFGHEIGKVEEASPVQDGKIVFGRIVTTTAFDPDQPFSYRAFKLKIVGFGMEGSVSGLAIATPTIAFQFVTCSLVN